METKFSDKLTHLVKEESEEHDYTFKYPLGHIRDVGVGKCAGAYRGVFNADIEMHFSHPTDDPILIEESICEDSGQHMWKTRHAQNGRDNDANQQMPAHSAEVLSFDLDIDYPEGESDSLRSKYQNAAPLYEHESPPRSPTPPHHTTVPAYVKPTKEQEGDLEPDEDDNTDCIVVECATSDRCSESSDDSNDEESIEEPRRLGKRKRV
jgi:hypothetical protein